jgi:hypothetical protein
MSGEKTNKSKASVWLWRDLARTPVGDGAEHVPQPEPIAVTQCANRIKYPDGFDDHQPALRESGSVGFFRVSVAYNEARFEHQILKFVEPLNILLQLLIVWCHMWWCGGFSAPGDALSVGPHCVSEEKHNDSQTGKHEGCSTGKGTPSLGIKDL